MPVYLIPIIIVGSACLVFIAFLLRAFLAPRRIEAIADLVRLGKIPQATRAAKAIIAKDERDVDARFLLGQAYLKDGKPELALMEFKTVNQIGMFGGYATERVFRAEAAKLYQRYNQVEEALKEYLLLIRMEPDDAENYFHCGQLFEKRDDTDKATRYYIKTIQLDPKNGAAHFRLGLLLYRQKKSIDAKSELSIAIKLDPDNCEAHFYLGRMLKEAGDYTGALASFERAQKSPELKVRALVERGGTFLKMNNYERALADLGRAVRISDGGSSPEVLYGHYFLSVCYEKKRQLDKAIEHWEHIYSKKPTFLDVAEKLSQYQDLRTDDRMKDYVTASREEFLQICQDASRAINLTVRDTRDVTNGCQIIASDKESKWRNARRIDRMIWFLRVPEAITDSAVRSLLEEMRKTSVPRGVIFTISSFSRTAREYAESRPVDLYDKEHLQKVLARMGSHL